MPSPHPEIANQTPLGPVIAEGRVLDDIADSLGISYGDLRAAINELVKIGWVSLELVSEGLVLSLPEDARVAS